MKRRSLLLGIAAFLLVVGSSFVVRSGILRGTLGGTGTVEQRAFTFADIAPADGHLTPRELRRALVRVIVGTSTQDLAFDVDGNGVNNKADVTEMIRVIRFLLGCGNGTIDAGESCDDAGTGSGDGCSATCGIEPGFVCSGTPSQCSAAPASLASWSGSVAFIAGLAKPLTFNQGVHVLNPTVVALRDASDNAVAVWAESKLNSGDWRSPLTVSIVTATLRGTEWTRHVLSPEVSMNSASCRFCTEPVLTADSAGRAHLFWMTPMHDGALQTTGYALYASVSTGSTFAHPWYVSGIGTNRMTPPGVAFNAAGKGIAVWEELVSNTGGTLMASHYDPQSGWSPPETAGTFTAPTDAIMNNGGTNQLTPPAVGIDANGRVTALYRSTSKEVDGSTSGLHDSFRDDLLSRTWNQSDGWSAPEAAVQTIPGWIGPSFSYQGMQYQHSVHDYRFSVRPDGNATLVYVQADPNPAQGSLNLPTRNVYAKRLSGGTWSAAVKLSTTPGVNDLRFAAHPSEDSSFAAWSAPCGQTTCSAAALSSGGTWTQASLPQASAGATPLFLSYFEPRHTFVLGTSQHYTSLINPDVFLQEFSPQALTWAPRVASKSTPFFMRDAQAGSASAGLHRLFTLWSEEKRTTYENEPQDYYMYQLDARAGFLGE